MASKFFAIVNTKLNKLHFAGEMQFVDFAGDFVKGLNESSPMIKRFPYLLIPEYELTDEEIRRFSPSFACPLRNHHHVGGWQCKLCGEQNRMPR